MNPKGILFHTTNNWKDGAGDELHGEYMRTVKDRVVSWHVTVDKDSATQHIPFGENAWHAGDGKTGEYNRNWIGVEIACEAVEPGQSLDQATYQNAVDVVAQLMEQLGLSWERLQPHHVVYGKNCPHTSLFDRIQFKKDVIARMEENKKQLFSDVPAGAWYEDELKIAVKRGILTGNNGQYRPDQPVTRAELAAVVAKLLRELS